jgi:hypothetical protein
MIIDAKKFGDILLSRPAGKEAFLIIKSYLLNRESDEKIQISFEGVKVVGPSWLEEVLYSLKKEYPQR